MKTSVDYSRIPTSALVALAQLVLKRAKLSSIPVETREQAIRVLQGVRPAPPRKSKINVKPVYALCCVCFKPLVTGTLVDPTGTHHIQCEVK
jgi:hypothetical protein